MSDSYDDYEAGVNTGRAFARAEGREVPLPKTPNQNQSSNQDNFAYILFDQFYVELDVGQKLKVDAVLQELELNFRSVQDIREAIGKDEWNPLPKRNNYVGIRNTLRKELRTKLNLEEL